MLRRPTQTAKLQIGGIRGTFECVDTLARVRYAFQFARAGNSLRAATGASGHRPEPKLDKPPHG